MVRRCSQIAKQTEQTVVNNNKPWSDLNRLMMADQPQPLSLPPEEILYLTGDGALDDHNIPQERESPTKGVIPTTPTKIRVSNDLLYKRSKFFGSGTSKGDVYDILSQGDGKSPKHTTSPGKTSPQKKSPIKLPQNHPIKSFLKSTYSKSPSPKASSSFSNPQKCQTPSPRDKQNSPKGSPSLSSPSSKRRLVFSADQKNIENFAEDSETEPAYNKYYFETFYAMVQSVRNNRQMAHLFTEEEAYILENFKKDLPEFHLYVRFLNRVDTWKAVSSIKYPELGSNLSPLFSKLEEEGYIICDISNLAIEEVLNLLKVESLKTLCKEFKLGGGKVKNDMIESLCKFYRTQRAFSAVHPVRKRAEQQLGKCFRLSPKKRLLFRRCALLFSMFHSNDELDELTKTQGFLLLEVSRGNMIFPFSAMEVSKDYHIYDNRDQFLRYEQARELRQDMVNYEKDADKVEDITKRALTEFQDLLELKDEESASTLPPFLRRYRAGSVYARVLEKSADKLRTGKNLELAKKAHLALRAQNIYHPHRCGLWASMLATLLHVNCKDPVAAAEELCRGLQLEDVSTVDRTNLNNRAQLILKRKKTGLSKDLEDKLRSLMDRPHEEPVIVEVQGQSTNVQVPGRKTVWVANEADGGRGYKSVEEVVLDYYRNLGYTCGQHDEGKLIRSLCLLLMWNIIYDKDVPYVFLSEYQDKPLDWATPEFYTTRAQKIQDYLQSIETLGEDVLAIQLYSLIEQHINTVSLVAWEAFENIDLQKVLKCFKLPLFIAVCRRFMENFRSHRSGFPDLTLWDPSEEKCIFVEVKGPGDTLSTAQILWLEYLRRNGAEAVVANVRATGSKEGQRV